MILKIKSCSAQSVREVPNNLGCPTSNKAIEFEV